MRAEKQAARLRSLGKICEESERIFHTGFMIVIVDYARSSSFFDEKMNLK